MTPTQWSDAHVETLKRLWVAGMSASQVAGAINQTVGRKLFTRNAVIGKLHRLHMTALSRIDKRSTYLKPKNKPAPYRAPPAAKAVKTPLPPRKPPPAFLAPPEAEGMVIGDLRHFHCRHPINSWPKGYGDHARFCGEFAPEGSYCPHHTALNSGGKPEPKPKPAADFAPRRAA